MWLKLRQLYSALLKLDSMAVSETKLDENHQ